MTLLDVEGSGVPIVRVVAVGTPVPQGSKSPQVVGRWIKTKLGLALLNPRAILVDQTNMKSATFRSGRLTRWRADVRRAAQHAMGNAAPTDAHVQLAAEFVLPRPKSHYTTTGALSAAGRRHPYPGKPDLSKLMRAIEDAITGVVYADDRLIAVYGRSSKRWATHGKPGGVIIEVRSL